MQVEDPRCETCDQDVSRLVVGGGCQVVKIPLLVEEVSTRAEAKGNKERWAADLFTFWVLWYFESSSGVYLHFGPCWGRCFAVSEALIAKKKRLRDMSSKQKHMLIFITNADTEITVLQQPRDKWTFALWSQKPNGERDYCHSKCQGKNITMFFGRTSGCEELLWLRDWNGNCCMAFRFSRKNFNPPKTEIKLQN